ncbi:MAG: CPBP family intramembrane metalloprotease [Verrucomicrobiales bacterium]|nr:CPBP family intramembrane metalloprotease [Verrucomicrobiales bacterium]
MEEIAAKQVLVDFEIIALLVLFLGIAAFRLYRKFGPNDEIPTREFDGFDLVLMFFPALLFLFAPLLDLFAAKAQMAKGGEKSAPGVSFLLFNIFYFIFVGVMTYGIVAWVRNRDFAEVFGLRRRSFPMIVVCSIIGGLCSVLICAWAIGNLSEEFMKSVFEGLSAQELVNQLKEKQSTLYFVLSVVAACIAAPIAEEFLFRGYMYESVKAATNPLFSAIVVGALFAVAHVNLPALLPLWAFAIILCLAYEWSGTLWVPVGMHAFFNGANILLMQYPETVQ